MGARYSIPVHVLFGGGGILLSGIALALVPIRAHTKLLCVGDKDRWSDDERIKYQKMTDILAAKLAIGKPVQLVESCGLAGLAQAQGIRWGCGRVAIAIDPTASSLLMVRNSVLDNEEKDENDDVDVEKSEYYFSDSHMEFLLAHELAHIHHNDMLTLFALPGLAGVAATLSIFRFAPSTATIIAVPRSLSAITRLFFVGTGVASWIGTVVTMSFLCWLSQRREYIADATAFAICSDKGKAGAIEFFSSYVANHQEMNADPQSFMLARWCFSSEGNVRFDLFHPPLTKRIAAMQQQMQHHIEEVAVVNSNDMPDLLF